MGRAKIVCTLGPASSSPDVIARMIEAGMNVARLNFSHGDHSDHEQVYNTVRDVSRQMNRAVAIMQDLQGPKIRVGRFESDEVQLVRGDEFCITTDDIVGSEGRVSTTYKGLPRDVKVGDDLLLDDGLIRLRAMAVSSTDVVTEVVIGGTLKNNKGINIPSAAVSAPSMTPKDVEDLAFGLELGVDFVALSFVRSALDIHQLRSKLPGDDHPKIIAKIEKPQAIPVLADIVSVADGIMIARGDLGVELPPQRVPVIQKRAIRLANSLGRISITATQMLESMTESPRPTRAEASDVANAILDGTDAVMLSGETATGRFPVESVQMMTDIITEVESSPIYGSRPEQRLGVLPTFPNAVARSASIAAAELDVRGIVVLTLSGATARLLMSYRPTKPIFACTPDPKLAKQMALYWGVVPHHLNIELDGGHDVASYTTDRAIQMIETILRENHEIETGDEIIIVMGSPVRANAETNLVKFHRVS